MRVASARAAAADRRTSSFRGQRSSRALASTSSASRVAFVVDGEAVRTKGKWASCSSARSARRAWARRWIFPDLEVEMKTVPLEGGKPGRIDVRLRAAVDGCGTRVLGDVVGAKEALARLVGCRFTSARRSGSGVVVTDRRAGSRAQERTSTRSSGASRSATSRISPRTSASTCSCDRRPRRGACEPRRRGATASSCRPSRAGSICARNSWEPSLRDVRALP